jgi:Ca-activated chloride channel family protein
MHFANPSAFLLWIVLAAVAAWRESVRPPQAVLPFPDLASQRGLPQSLRARWRKGPGFLLYAAIALAVVALARPQSVMKGQVARAKGIDIMIALDTSGSMRALDFNPLDRMAAAKRAAKTFITHRQYDRIGLVAFAGVAILQCPLTLDYGALVNFLDQVQVGITSTENTAIGTAIATAANHLKKSTAKSRLIILMTDGRNNSGEIDPLTAAKAASALGVKIYTIGIGVHGRSTIPVDTPWGRQLVPIDEDLDEPALQEIADVSNGRYYRAASAKDFDQIYGEIDHLEKSDVNAPIPLDYEDHYFAWLMMALILATAGWTLDLTIFRTIP